MILAPKEPPATKRPSRKCVFCGNGKLSKEHIWSEWALDLLPASDGYLEVSHRNRGGKPVDHRIIRDAEGAITNKKLRRVKFLRRVLDTQGPLSARRSLGLAILDRFDQGRDIRNQMAYADMSVLPGIARFDEIVISNGEIIHRDTPYYAGQLERIAIKAARFSRAIQRIHYKMFGDELLNGG